MSPEDNNPLMERREQLPSPGDFDGTPMSSAQLGIPEHGQMERKRYSIHRNNGGGGGGDPQPTPNRQEAEPQADLLNNLTFRQTANALAPLEARMNNNVNLSAQERSDVENLRDHLAALVDEARHSDQAYMSSVDSTLNRLDRRLNEIRQLPANVQISRLDSFLSNSLDPAVCPPVEIDPQDVNRLQGLPQYYFEQEKARLVNRAEALLGLASQAAVREQRPAAAAQQAAPPEKEGEMNADREFLAFLGKEEAGLPPRENEMRFFKNTERIIPESEKGLLDARITLAASVQWKRNHDKPADLENNMDLKNLNKEQLRILCEAPGVMKSLNEYLYLLESDEKLNPPDGPAFREAKSTEVITEYREYVRGSIYNSFREQGNNLPAEWLGRLAQMDPAGQESFLRLKAREAEQISYNLHQAAMTFESFDSTWDGNTRRRQSSMVLSQVVHKAARGVMKPLDGLIDRSTAEEKKSKPQGKFGKWARAQLGGIVQKLGEDRYKSVIKSSVVALREGDAARWWTSDGRTLYVPEAYPIQTVGSMWEEIELGEHKLIDYIRAEQPIPWNATDESDPFETYLGRLGAAVKVNGYLTGEDGTAITGAIFGGNEGASGAMTAWYDKLARPLADLRRKDDLFLKRMIVYAAVGVKERDRLPMLDWTYDNKKALQTAIEGSESRSGRPRPNIFPKNQAYWSWDRVSGIRKLLLG